VTSRLVPRGNVARVVNKTLRPGRIGPRPVGKEVMSNIKGDSIRQGVSKPINQGAKVFTRQQGRFVARSIPAGPGQAFSRSPENHRPDIQVQIKL